ncbi:SRPBCC family protein [Sphingomonas sp.]|uniref:SRPBCC family protein n=1 Tax=Sphingomonas sp. TaxID=28214 RepID=UPI0025FE086C|nr:SRPBCC family protein [Sphingomonas sp.]MBV9527794.1 SRPBCC family protein [Sphingomonas sp.]
MAANDTQDRQNSNTQLAIIGAGLAAAAGTAAFLLARRTGSGGAPVEEISDAPDHVWRRGTSRYDQNVLGNTVTVGRSAEELYREWRDFTKFPGFMENVEAVETLGGDRSRWTIKAPAGASVELVTTVTEDRPNQAIAWTSDSESQITTEGRVEFIPAAPGRGTMVRLIMHYDPPGGILGKGIAKLFQREPKIQARRDLKRFKSLMETGEVATNASPSGRKSETPTEARI